MAEAARRKPKEGRSAVLSHRGMQRQLSFPSSGSRCSALAHLRHRGLVAHSTADMMTKSCYWSLIASQNRIATRRPASRCSCWSKRLGEATDTPGKQLIRHPGWLAESLTLAPSLSESHPAAAWLVGAERHVLPVLPPVPASPLPPTRPSSSFFAWKTQLL